MANYLIYCPTCKGKMSVNANPCPHCGENKFWQDEGQNEIGFVLCDCGGKNTVINGWKHEITYLISSLYVYDELNEAVKYSTHRPLSEEEKNLIRHYNSNGDFECSRQAFGERQEKVYYKLGRLTKTLICDKCKGTGSIMNIKYVPKFINLRKKV